MTNYYDIVYALITEKFAATQPRAPKGDPRGGQWIEARGSGAGGATSPDDYFTSGEANELPGNMQNKFDGGPGNSIQYHGTPNKGITKFSTNEVYLQSDPSEAKGYAASRHMMQDKKGGEILAIRRKPGKTLNLNPEIERRMMDGDDPDDVISEYLKPSMKRGYRYIYFEHPRFTGNGVQQVIISLYPGEDLSIVSRQKNKEILVKLITEKFAATQPRAPRGTATGGQWVDTGGSGAGGSTSTFQKVADVEYHDGKKARKAEVYKVTRFDAVPRGIAVVGVKDGEILHAATADATHGQMVRAARPGKTVDDYVRFWFDKGTIRVNSTSAGVEVGRSDWETPALDNIYKALGKLHKAGIPADTKVIITLAKGSMTTTVKTLRNTTIKEFVLIRDSTNG